MNQPAALLQKLELVNKGISELYTTGIPKIKQIITIAARLWDCPYIVYHRARTISLSLPRQIFLGEVSSQLALFIEQYVHELDQEGGKSYSLKPLQNFVPLIANTHHRVPRYCIAAKALAEKKFYGTLAFIIDTDQEFTTEDEALLQLLLNLLCSEEQRLEQQLAINNYSERLEVLFETIPIMMLLVDRNNTVFSSNQQALQVLGYNPKEINNTSLLALYYPEEHQAIRKHLKNCFDQPSQSFSWESRLLTKANETLWVKQNARLIKINNELELLLLLSDDITERITFQERISSINAALENGVKERTSQLIAVNQELKSEIAAKKAIEDTLRSSKNLIEEATKVARLGSFEYSYNTGDLTFSEEFKNIFGLPEQSSSDLLSILKNRFPEDQLELLREGARSIQSRTDYFNGTCQIKRTDGKELVLAIRLRPLLIDNKIAGIFGTVQDITEQTEAEAKYSIMVNAISSLTDTVVVTDIHERITYVNKAFVRSYGYDEHELIGKHINIIRPKNTPADLQFLITNETLRDGWQGELLNCKKDGTEFPIFLTTSKVTNSKGKITALIGVSRDITAEKAAKEALIQSEEKFRSLFENVHDIFFILERNGTITEISPSIQFYNEKSREQIIGMHISDGFLYDNKDIPKLLKVLVQQKEIIDFELRLKGINGLLLFTSCNARATCDVEGRILKIEGTLRDITDRKAAELALIKQLKIEEFIASLSSRFINVSLLEVKKTIMESIGVLGKYTNSGIINISLNDGDDHVGRSFFWSKTPDKEAVKIFTTPEAAYLHKALEKSVSIKPILLRYTKHRTLMDKGFHGFFRNSGLTAAFLLPLFIRRKYCGYLGFFYSGSSRQWMSGDVSYLTFVAEIFSQLFERKKMEAELIEAKKIAEESLKIKEHFLAHMSHELRTPLNAIIGSTFLFERTLPTPKQREYVDTIRISADTLLSLVNDILEYSKIKAGKIEFTYVDFSLRNLIHRISKIAWIQAEHKQLKMEALIDDNVPDILVGDPERLSQILINLLINAIKYTDKGSVTLHIAVRGATPEETTITFKISDTGIGISKPNQRIIFDEFTRSRSHASRQREGTGLGLSICKNLTTLMGGTIAVNSKMGVGSTFTVTIPFQTTNSVNAANVHLPVMLEGALKGVKVLVVEDNEFNRLILHDLLRSWKAVSSFAFDGEQAYEMIQHDTYAVVLLDLGLPNMSGFDLARLIRNSLTVETRKVPIIALTAANTREEQRKALEAGIDDYLVKPFNEAVLFEKILRLVGTGSGIPAPNQKKSATIISKQKRRHFIPEQLMGTRIFNQSFLADITNQFIKNAPDELKKMGHFISLSDYVNLRAAAHRTKSMYMYLKLNKAVHLIKKIEALAASEGSIELLQNHLQTLTTITGQVILEMNQMISEN